MTAWIVLFSIGGIAVLLLLRGIYETFTLDVSFSALGEGNHILRVLLFSDLHAGSIHLSKKRLRKAFLSAKADLFLFAGDMTLFRRDLKKGEEYMAFFASLAKECGVPFIAVLGNHDIFELNERLPDLGILLLKNESIPIEAADRFVWLVVGLDDHRIGNPSYKTALKHFIRTDSPLDDHADSFAVSCPQVILAHNPDSIFLLPETTCPDHVKLAKPYSATLSSPNPKRIPPIFLLSGHFHGGQIWMPFHLEYRILREEIMPKLGFCKGTYQKDGIWGYISRGLGTVIVPLRFLSHPELTFLELRADGPESIIQP